MKNKILTSIIAAVMLTSAAMTVGCGKTGINQPETTANHTHDYSNSIITKEASHAENGEVVFICSCGDTKKIDIEPTNNHSYGSGVITKAATRTEDGVITFICSCGETKTETIAKFQPLEWAVSGDTLKITGNGPMDNYDDADEAPWHSLSSNVKNIVIAEGVASIGNNAFSDFTNLTSVTIPSSVTSIGDSAFVDCVNLITLTIPNSVTSIGDCAFRYCDTLPSININSKEDEVEFDDCSFPYECKIIFTDGSFTLRDLDDPI